MSTPVSTPTARISARTVLILVGLGAFVALLVHDGRLSQNSLLAFAVFVPSIVLHEVAHGVAAWRLGDQTARRAGRLSLNPARHVDPVGTLVLPALTILAGYGFIGWAKPVPVDTRQLRSPRNASVAVALAGPFTNLALVGIAYLGFQAVYDPAGVTTSLGVRAFFYLGLVNLWLAALNMLPIPPLDGSALVERLLPGSLWPGYLRIRHLFFPILMAVLLASTVLHLGLLSGLNSWLTTRWLSILGV